MTGVGQRAFSVGPGKSIVFAPGVAGIECTITLYGMIVGKGEISAKDWRAMVAAGNSIIEFQDAMGGEVGPVVPGMWVPE